MGGGGEGRVLKGGGSDLRCGSESMLMFGEVGVGGGGERGRIGFGEYFGGLWGYFLGRGGVQAVSSPPTSIPPPHTHTQVQGLVRVPLGGGLPTFLRHQFIGDARAQLLGALPGLGDPRDGDRSPPGSKGEREEP